MKVSGEILSRWRGVKIRLHQQTAPALSQNHILDLKSPGKNKTIRLSPQSPERVHAGKPSRKKKQQKKRGVKVNHRFSLCSRSRCWGNTTTVEKRRPLPTLMRRKKTQTEICFHGTVTSVCSLLYLKALKQGMLETERVWFDSEEIKQTYWIDWSAADV